MTINRSWHYTATIVTTDGTFRIELLPRVAPLAVNSFVFLAKHHFYNGLIFHRIIRGFVIQTGDPTGTGFGGPGYHFATEPVHMPYTWGTVALANSGPNTNGSQFFIVTGKRIKLAPNYTIFGKVIAGRATINRLDKTAVMLNPGTNEFSEPVHPPKMESVSISVTR